MQLVLVGASHRSAPVEIRERMGFDRERGKRLVERLARGDAEAVALATCNRVCLYLAHERADEARERALAELAGLSRMPLEELLPYLYVKVDEEAARHLFRVAAGLDSLVPGEAQILGQVRDAFEASDEVGAAGRVLHRLFRQALHTGRRVRNETAIGSTPVSVSTAAAELAARIFDDLERRTLLLVGAGKMAELAAREVIARGVGRLVVANRSLEHAEQLVAGLGGRAAPLDALEEELAAADVVIASTGAKGLVLTAEQAERALRRHRGRPLFFIDIAVPRDLDPRINDLDGCYLYDVDDLERAVDTTAAGHHADIARAEAIAREEAEAFRVWQRSLDVVPAIASLRRRAEEIRAAELARSEPRLRTLSERERSIVESMTAQIVNKLLHVPTVRLKEAAATADGAAYAETVRHLFDLADDSV